MLGFFVYFCIPFCFESFQTNITTKWFFVFFIFGLFHLFFLRLFHLFFLGLFNLFILGLFHLFFLGLFRLFILGLFHLFILGLFFSIDFFRPLFFSIYVFRLFFRFHICKLFFIGVFSKTDVFYNFVRFFMQLQIKFAIKSFLATFVLTNTYLQSFAAWLVVK